MGHERLKYPQWQIPLQELVCDARPNKIDGQAHKLQGLIFERFHQLDKEGDSEAERQALKSALTVVQIIMGDKPAALLDSNPARGESKNVRYRTDHG
jgi:hypothetical protein